MHMSHAVRLQAITARTVLVLLLSGMTLLVIACGGSAQVRLQTQHSQAHLDRLLQQALQIGVPASFLQPVLRQKQVLSSTSIPFNPFSDQSTNDYYHNLTTQYAQLAVKLQRIVALSKTQARVQAQQDIHNFQLALTQQYQHFPTQSFKRQLSQLQMAMPRAQYPKDYVSVSNIARSALQALTLLPATLGQIGVLHSAIESLQTAQLDVTSLQMSYQLDQQMLASATTLPAFQQLDNFVGAQCWQAVTRMSAAIPYSSAERVHIFEQQLQLLNAARLASGPYQQKLMADQALISKPMSIQDYLMFVKQIDADIVAAHIFWLRGSLLEPFHREADVWGNSHLYDDTFNRQSYPLDNGYLLQGIGSDLDAELVQVKTLQDAENTMNDINDALFDLHMMEANAQDTTAYNQVHATDLHMLQHYKLQKGRVLLVSLTEQAMRIYQDGRLVRAFLVTTGRPELPSLPGIWPTLSRMSPTIFKSGEPIGSPYWYPDTSINYAILYHEGGYFVHDSWWRGSYGPGTQFPHADATGNQSFAGDGSHGCINMEEGDAAWVYDNTDWNTTIVIY